MNGRQQASRKVKRMLLLLLALCCLLLNGCWSRKELNELGVVMALGIDLDNGGYLITAQIMNPSEIGAQMTSSGRSPVVTYKAKGSTIPDALRRMLGMTSRRPYLSHLRVVVLGEDLARLGLSGALEYLNRSHEVRTDFLLAVAKNNSAEQILEVLTPSEKIPANNLFNSIQTSHRNWAATGEVTLNEFLTTIQLSGKSPTLPGVEIIGDRNKGLSLDNTHRIKPDTLLKHSGMAVFENDQLVGWLDEADSKAVNYVTNQMERTTGVIRTNDNITVGVTVQRSKCRIKAILAKDEKPRFQVELELQANINTIEDPVNIEDTQLMRKLENEVANRLNATVETAIAHVQKQYKADIFGFGEVLHRRYPSVWKAYRERWKDTFPEVEYGVHTKVYIRNIGSSVQPLGYE